MKILKVSDQLAVVFAAAFVCFSSIAVQAQTALAITTTALDSCVVDDSCRLQVQASGGTPALRWKITRGSLPPGLQLDPTSGIISGAATAAGDNEIMVELSDTSEPAQKTSRIFKIRVIRALEVDWKKPPTLTSTTIGGSAKVSNNSSNVHDLTVIIVAVNEFGKAFALGYQHFNLLPKAKDQEIPFESQLPGGRYTVRVDAIGEVPAKNRIYRAAKQAGPFQVPVQ